jgi:hypothetical protein
MSTSDGAAQPRIARIWRGRTTRERADEYAPYLYETGIRPLEEKALGVQMFREDRETDSEFVTISYWESWRRCRDLRAMTPSASITSSAIPSS